MPAGLDNFGSSLKGMFTDGAGSKAVLYVYLTDPTKSMTAGDFKDEVKSLNDLNSSLLKSTKSRLSPSSMWDSVKSNFGGKNPDKIGEVTSDGKFIKFTVQYNPSTIRLTSISGKIQSRKADEGIDKLSVYTFQGKSKLSFDLIFDDVDNMNAFQMNDIVNTNISGALNKAGDAISHGGLNHSVRKRMDAILSLLSSRATQQVIFFWGKMSFRGTITDVGNRFTMFNPQGNPIRGEMHLELTQDKASKDLGYDEKYWDDAFKKCFSKSAKGVAGASKGSGVMDRLTNNGLINL